MFDLIPDVFKNMENTENLRKFVKELSNSAFGKQTNLDINATVCDDF